MQIAIIGAGNMGKWFARHFKRKSADILIYDLDKDRARETAEALEVGFAPDLEIAIAAEVLFIAVPLSKTPEVVEDIGSRLRMDQTLVEIASLKSEVAKELGKLDCQVLSIHPLFGPGADSISGQNIAVISESSSNEAKETMLPLLKGAKIKECSVAEHDQAMAMVLSLPFAMNIAFLGMVDSEMVPEGLRGTTFLQQLTIARKVSGEDEDLRKELMKNKYFRKILKGYIKKARELLPND
jgi:prephenate dehydrogenase